MTEEDQKEKGEWALKKESFAGKQLITKASFSVLAICLFAVMAVVISASAYIFAAAEKINKESVKLNQIKIETIKENVLSCFATFGELGNSMTNDEWIQSYSSVSQYEEAQSFNVAKVGKDALYGMVSLKGGMLRRISVYFPVSSTVVSSDQIHYMDTLSQYFSSNACFNREMIDAVDAWALWRTFWGNGEFVMVRDIKEGGVLRASIIIELDLAKIGEKYSIDDEIIIMGTESECLFTNSAIPDFTAEYANILYWNRNGQESRIAGKTYTGTLGKSTFSRLNVAVLAPVSKILTGTNFFKSALAILMITGTVSTTLLLIFLKRQVLQPIQKLAAAGGVSEKSHSLKTLMDNASDKIGSIEYQNQAMVKELEWMKPIIIGRQLYSILKRKSGGVEEIAQQCFTLLGIQPEGQYCLMYSCVTEDPDNFFGDESLDIRSDKRLSFAHFIIDNIITYLMPPDCKMVLCPLGDSYILFSEGFENQEEIMSGVAEKLLEACRDQFHVTLKVGKPVIREGITTLQEAMVTATKEIQYLQFWGESSAPAEENSMADTESFSREIRMFLNMVRVGNYKAASDKLDEVLLKALPKSEEKLTLAKYRAYGLGIALTAELSERTQTGDSIENILNYEKKIVGNKLNSIQEIRRELKRILNELQNQQLGMDVGNRIEEVKQYINEHYTENELSVKNLAEVFDISEAYLSRSFKKYTQVTILDYITKKRVEQAKQLLRTETVKATAAKVGFWDAQGLVRAFKKLEGITPLEYKHHIMKQ